eukprot:scpid56189/ scgid31186/ 
MAMASSFCQMEPFDGQNFSDYLDRLECYFAANRIGVAATTNADDVTAAGKVKTAALIALVGKATYSTLKDLCFPDKPTSKTFDEIADLLKKHFQPKLSLVAESYRFHQCRQGTESVTEFANRLKRLASTCEFDSHLDCALKDQFVQGLRGQSITKKLLTMANDNTFADFLATATYFGGTR